jgi:hypothetical protein
MSGYDATNPPSFRQIVDRAEKNAEAGRSSGDELSQFGRQWFYGPGFGRTLANVGTVVLFPPYALYLLGNAGLALAGYQQLYLTSALPNPARRYVLDVYDGVTSVPGRITSTVAGEEFQTQSPPALPAKEDQPPYHP